MKLRLLIILALLTAPLSASAQWYLFPGTGHRQDTTKTAKPDTVKKIQDAVDTLIAPVVDTLEVVAEDAFEGVRVSLILPLNVNGTPSSNFLDFYSGALLAANDLISAGVKMELNVFDTMEEANPASTDVLAASDVILGPVSVADISRELLVCPFGKSIVSPLDPKAIELTSTHSVIQAPSSWENQAADLVDWLSSEVRAKDRVILLQSGSEEAGEAAPYIVGALNGTGINYTIASSAEEMTSPEGGCLRFIVVSDNDMFCSAKVREIALLAVKENNVALYSTSRIRSAADVEAGGLHMCNARITVSYYADPRNAAVKKFSGSYLKLFSAEPGSFAYQGYDLMHYFVSAATILGKGWEDRLEEYREEGLQTGFIFNKNVRNGKANTAVRRLRYRGDNLITIEK